MDKVSLTLRLDEDLHEKLRQISFDEKRSINNLINYILEKYVEEEEKKNPTL